MIDKIWRWPLFLLFSAGFLRPVLKTVQLIYDSLTLWWFLSAIRSFMVHIPNTAKENNYLKGKACHTLCPKSEIKSICYLPKYKSERQSRPLLSGFCHGGRGGGYLDSFLLPIIVYSVVNCRPHLSHFCVNM